MEGGLALAHARARALSSQQQQAGAGQLAGRPPLLDLANERESRHSAKGLLHLALTLAPAQWLFGCPRAASSSQQSTASARPPNLCRSVCHPSCFLIHLPPLTYIPLSLDPVPSTSSFLCHFAVIIRASFGAQHTLSACFTLSDHFCSIDTPILAPLSTSWLFTLLNISKANISTALRSFSNPQSVSL